MQHKAATAADTRFGTVETNEFACGGTVNSQLVIDKLKQARDGAPIDLPRELNGRALAEYFDNRSNAPFDLERFERVVEHAAAKLKSRNANFVLLDPARFYVGTVATGVSDGGGFHSAFGRGFHPLHRVGLGVVLNGAVGYSRSLGALELARSYLHDSLHAATYMTWRLVREQGGAVRVWRDQYGINFRRSSGTSYSSRDATRRSPDSINLNLLMDGLIVLLVSSSMSDFTSDESLGPDRKSRTVLADLRCEASGLLHGTNAEVFYREIVRPTRRFVDHWGGEPFADLVLEAMLTGKMKTLLQAFTRDAPGRAWRNRFMSPTWRSRRSARE